MTKRNPTESNADILWEHGPEVYTIKREKRRQEQRAKAGFAATRHGQALVKLYEKQFSQIIGAYCNDRRHDRSGVWEAIKDIDHVAVCILALGVTAAMDAKTIGIDRDDDKNHRDVALWIGDQFKQWIGDKLEDQKELQYRIGAWCIDRLLDIRDASTSLPVFGTGEHDELIWLGMTEQAAFLEAVTRLAVARTPFIFPTAEAPEPWTGVWKGGRTSETSWTRVPLVADRVAQIEMDRAINDGKMNIVLDAINGLQRVPFIINTAVLDVASQMAPSVPDRPKWLPRGRIPQWRTVRRHLEAEARKHSQDESCIKAEVEERLNELRDYLKAQAKKEAWDTDMTTANILADRGRFFVPLHLDFRGRIYGVPLFNFQGPDHVRGLFYFADGKVIGDEGLRRLKYYVAGSADGNNEKPSKLSRENRIAWTDDNMPRLRAIGEAVENGNVPSGLESIDDPVQFLAACYELKRAIDIGPETFVTHLPTKVDASCSGMQHLCGMTRSEDGKLVNLTPPGHNSGPGDLYRDVAARAAEFFTDRWYVELGGKTKKKTKNGKSKDKDNVRLKTFLTKAEADCFAGTVKQFKTYPQAAADKFVGPVDVLKTGHIDVEIDRALAKKPVLSYFYGATRYGMTGQVAKFLKDDLKQPATGASRIAEAIHKALEDVAPAAKDVRQFLEPLAALCAKQNKLLKWVTPLGLPVLNLAYEPEMATLKTQFRGHRKRVDLALRDSDRVDEGDAVRAVTANFTHSMDACHLMMIARAADRYGIDMAAIHDCYACLAPHATIFNKAILGSFFALYQFNYVLTHISLYTKRGFPGVEVPQAPPFGELNLKQVFDSTFFVS